MAEQIAAMIAILKPARFIITNPLFCL